MLAFRAAHAPLFKILSNRDVWAIAFLFAFPWLYFWRVTLGQAVWFTTDIMLLYHPFGVELSRALAENRLPLWSPNFIAGFPLIAEGHVATFSPIYLLLFKFLPPHFAISYGMVLHLSWIGVGMYVCARAMQLNRPSALLAGFIFSFNGLTLEKLYHTPILVASAWLPWLIFLHSQFLHTHKRIWFLLLTFSIGLQLVSGFPQTALLSAMTLGLFGLFEIVTEQAYAPLRRFLVSTILPLGLGAGIAAIQIVPTMELIQQSVRGAAMSKDYLTEYSLPPSFLAQFIFPYTQGEPIEHTNEYWAYFGIAPFALAILAPLIRRTRRTLFLTLFVLITLSFALGSFNPAYELIYRLPLFNLFRTPARYIFLALFGAILLSAIAFDELSNRLASSRVNKKAIGIATILGALAGISFWLTQSQSLEFWLTAWQWLPFAIGIGAVCFIALAWRRKILRATFIATLLGLTLFDLVSFAPPFLFTLAQLTPPSYVETPPRVVNALGEPRVTDRVLTDLSIVPSVPAVRGSLAPNQATVYGRQSAQVYSPLPYARHEEYLNLLSAPMLNLLNVRYFMLPLEPRTHRIAAPTQSLAWLLNNEPARIAATLASAIQVTSFTEQTANLPAGTLAAHIVLTLDDNSTLQFPLRVSVETDDWDFDRANDTRTAQHPRARVAHSYPGATRAYGKLFEAHTYRARYELAPARRIVAMNVESALPDGRLCIESVSLIGENNQAISLATLTGKPNLSVAYMSDTVGAWENRDQLPRAFIVHTAEIADDATAFARLQKPDFPADRIVLLEQGVPLQFNGDNSLDRVEIRDYKPEHIALRAATDRPGYLVLTDAWYPGWNAWVDAEPIPISRADVLFRAVPLESGEHDIVFDYQPMSLVLGAGISALCGLVTLGIAFFIEGFVSHNRQTELR
ncbi:MAG: YfhO family protein [Chloroflexi bacterium]|nr:YfhO family protein [Chloroflexota bacterium]